MARNIHKSPASGRWSWRERGRSRCGGLRLTTEERTELVCLRRANRVLEMDWEIIKRAAAFFGRENVLPK